MPNGLGLYLGIGKSNSLYFFTFLCSCFSWDLFIYLFAHSPKKYEWFSNRSIWFIDGIITGSTTLCWSGPGSNGNEEVLNTPGFDIKWTKNESKMEKERDREIDTYIRTCIHIKSLSEISC